MKILVTGGAGYLGSVLVPMLLEHHHQVTVLDTFQHGVPSLAGCAYNSLLKVIRGDARRESLLTPLVAEADAVIPLAAVVGASACEHNKIATRTTNIEAIETLTELLSQNQRVIYPNTNSGYGIGTKEECTEESPLKPVSYYGKTKVQAEEHLLCQHPYTVSLRFATLFGMSPRMRLDLLVNDFVFRAARDRSLTLFEGHFRRNFLHVRDAALAILHSLDNKKVPSGIYNVGDSRINITKQQLCCCIQKHIPEFVWYDAKIGVDPDQRDYIVSNQKIMATGWHPRHTLDNGIQELVRGSEMIRNQFTNY